MGCHRNTFNYSFVPKTGSIEDTPLRSHPQSTTHSRGGGEETVHDENCPPLHIRLRDGHVYVTMRGGIKIPERRGDLLYGRPYSYACITYRIYIPNTSISDIYKETSM